MRSSLAFLAFLVSLVLGGCAHPGGTVRNVSDLAGTYSSAHPITINGLRVSTNGYLTIDRAGRITAYEQEGEGPSSAGAGCYRLATGVATNAGLQGRVLAPGLTPKGDAIFQTQAGDFDTFGILAEPGGDGTMRWYFHAGVPNSTVLIVGMQNVVNSSNHASYSISGPPLTSPSADELRGMLCPSTPKR